VNTLAVSPDGALWAGTVNSVMRFDGRAWQVLAKCDGHPFCGALDIAFASDGAVWTANGFNVARFDGQTWTRYEKKVAFLWAAPGGAVWMNGWEGSQGSGYVARFDGENWQTRKTADAFPYGFMVGAVTDDGRVWGVVPERGLASFTDLAVSTGTDLAVSTGTDLAVSTGTDPAGGTGDGGD
jgi:hypothetical protein